MTRTPLVGGSTDCVLQFGYLCSSSGRSQSPSARVFTDFVTVVLSPSASQMTSSIKSPFQPASSLGILIQLIYDLLASHPDTFLASLLPELCDYPAYR